MAQVVVTTSIKPQTVLPIVPIGIIAGVSTAILLGIGIYGYSKQKKQSSTVLSNLSQPVENYEYVLCPTVIRWSTGKVDEGFKNQHDAIQYLNGVYPDSNMINRGKYIIFTAKGGNPAGFIMHTDHCTG
jgi:hypothetical protein